MSLDNNLNKWISTFNTYKIGTSRKYEIFLSNRLGESEQYLGRSLSQLTLDNEILFVAVRKINKSNKNIDIFKELFRKQYSYIEKYYDVIDEHDATYVITEYSNRTLDKLLTKPLQEKYIKYYFKQIVNAIKFLYSLNMVHNDITSSNIILSENNKVIKLCNFEYVTKSMYDVDMSNEIYSLGLILHEMIYGARYDINKKINLTMNNQLNELLIGLLNKQITFKELCSNIWLFNKILPDTQISIESLSDIYRDETNASSESLDDIFEIEINQIY